MRKITKQQFIAAVTNMIKETYPTVTEEIVTKEYESLVSGNRPTNIIGMLISGNMQKFDII